MDFGSGVMSAASGNPKRLCQGYQQEFRFLEIVEFQEQSQSRGLECAKQSILGDHNIMSRACMKSQINLIERITSMQR